MVISCRFPLSFDGIMRNYIVYNVFTNWNIGKSIMVAACSPTHAARSTKCLRERQRLELKSDRPATSRERAEHDPSKTIMADAMRDLFEEKQTHTLLSWPIYIYISIYSMLTTPCTSRTTGGFVFFFTACFAYHGQLRSRSDGRIFYP